MQRRHRTKQVVSMVNSLRLKEVTGNVHLRNGEMASGPFEIDVNRFPR